MANQCCGSGSAWIQQKIKRQRNKKTLFLSLGLWILDCVHWKSVQWNRKWQIVGKFFFLKGVFQILNNMVGSGSETGSGNRKIQSYSRSGTGSGINHSGSATLLMESKLRTQFSPRVKSVTCYSSTVGGPDTRKSGSNKSNDADFLNLFRYFVLLSPTKQTKQTKLRRQKTHTKNKCAQFLSFSSFSIIMLHCFIYSIVNIKYHTICVWNNLKKFIQTLSE